MNNKIYIGSINIKDYTSFKGMYDFDLRDENGFIYQWTVILGNNNTGKTNFLKAVAGLEPVVAKNEENQNYCIPIEIEKSFITDKNEYSIESELYFSNNVQSYQAFSEKMSVYKDTPYKFSPEKIMYIWGYNKSIAIKGDYEFLKDIKIYGYGVSRKFGESSLSQKETTSNSETLFYNNKTLLNIEEWLLQLDYATKNNDKIANGQLIKLKELINSEIFPEIEGVRFISENAKNHVEFLTKEGWRKLSQLGYGYQTTLSWIFDFSKKMFERYPNSENPLKEPAVVLIDELDLHLHPQWQRQIINFLTTIFSQTQFIVTTHSPFIIQSIEKINLFILDRTSEGINVHRPKFKTFKGWAIEEILDEIHGLGEKTKSDNYLMLIKQFDKALDSNDYEAANRAYTQLCDILHPTSPERKLLKVQLSQIVPND